MVDIDIDKWCYFELLRYVEELHKDFKYRKRYKIW